MKVFNDPDIIAKVSSMDIGCDWKDNQCNFSRAAQQPDSSYYKSLQDGRITSDEYQEILSRVCCHGCARFHGFLGVKSVPEMPAEYVQHWDERTGFWRPGAGCQLPVEMRSITCLTHLCEHANPDAGVREYLESFNNQGEL